MPEPRLKELAGSSRLALGFFNSVIRRVECTKPIAGSNITIQQAEDGIIVNSTGGGTEYTLNICKNGEPGTIKLYGPPNQSVN